MSEHPIEGLMNTAMNSIKDMVDVNTIIGEPIETSNNIVIIPISKVAFGFGAGGSEFRGETIDEYTKKDKEEAIQYRLPFGGGSLAGVNINPVAFLVIQSNSVKLMPVEHSSCIDRLLDYMPDVIEKTNNLINKTIQNNKEEKNKVRQEESKLKKEELKGKEKIQDEKIIQKTRPKRTREPQNVTYEFEYDQVNNDDIEEIEYEDYDE